MKPFHRSIILLLCLSGWLLACRSQPAPPAVETVAGQLKLSVGADGFYRLTLAQLQAAGLDVNALDTGQLNLTTAGTAVPLWIDGDALIFYGQAPDSRYLANRPYILAAGAAGQSMAVVDLPAATEPTLTQVSTTQRLEENQIYEPRARATGLESEDLWFWQTINHQQQVAIPFDVPAVGDGSGAVTLNLWGFTHNPSIDPDHDLDVLVNGRLLDTIRWDGETSHTATLSIPAGVLQSGRNELILDNQPESAAMPDIMRLNWVDVTAATPPTAVNGRFTPDPIAGTLTLSGFRQSPALFDVGDPTAPTRLQVTNPDAAISLTADNQLVAIEAVGYRTPGIEPLRQSLWHTPHNAADLVILTTDALLPALEPLVAHRQEQGLAVAAIPVAEIYDAFGAGAATPAAIQTFIAYALESWQTPPRYLHIVGDATSDYRGYLGDLPAANIPAPMVAVQFGGETVSDARLADADGDFRPDVAVGRWPVNTPDEVADLVERTIAYEAGTAVDTTLFAADPSESRFAELATVLAFEGGLDADTVIQLNGPEAAEVGRAWEDGAWLVTYVGHGSIQQWGQTSLLSTDNVTALQTDQPGIMLQLTCLTGLFADPAVPSLAETLLLQPGGPVLQIAATSLTLSNNQAPFATSLLQALQSSDSERIGDALQTAKTSLNVNNPGLREISDTFILIGDPAAKIVRPPLAE